MEDISALKLVRQEIENIKGLSNIPVISEDETKLNVFENNCISITNHAVATITQIAKYAKEIDRQLEQLRLALNNSTKTVQERLKETLNSITIRNEKSKISVNSKKGEHVGTSRLSGTRGPEKKTTKNDPYTSKETSQLDAKKLEFALRLQKIEELKQKIQESLVLTQKLINDIDNGTGATLKDVENLKGSINGWMVVEKDKNKEDQRKLDERRQNIEQEEKRMKEEQEKKEEEERRQRESNDRKRKEEERRLKEEEEVRIRAEEELKRKMEEASRIREEEERNRKMEEERLQRAEEERLRKEEEDRKLKEEEEKRLKEEEERRQREDEEERRRNEEEEERKRQKKREEEERLRKQEEERKRIEEENRRKDPVNWTPIIYKRPGDQTSAFHRGVCCQVAAMDELLEEEDLECLASDEWREEDRTSVLNVDEKLASSIISIDAKSGEKTFPVPMRMYVPHCSISNSSDEIVVKVSIDGGEWTEQRPISVPQSHIGRLGLSYAGIDVCKFKTVKMVAVAKTRSQNFVVDQGGTNQISTVDKNIKLFVPRDTFSKRCTLKLEVRQMKEHSLAFATEYYEHCRNILSTSSIMKITSENVTDKCIEIDLARTAWNDKRSREKGKHIDVYKCRGESWKIADSEFKGRNMDVSVTLPSRNESYVVMEIEGRPTVPNEEFLKAADELYFHSNTSIVRIIAKQRADNPYIMMIQCVERDRVASRMSELEIRGYSLGPDTSKEFSLLDGQGVTLECSGNISMATGSKVKLTFHSYMDTAKQEVSLQVVDEFKQKHSNVYLGNLQFEVMRDKRDGAFHNKNKGSLPLTLPKVERGQKRKTIIQIRFPHYLTALAKFLASRLTTTAKDDNWIQVMYSLDSRRIMDNIRRNAVTRCETPASDQQICELILHDWMKTKPVQDDKINQILGALRNCQRMTLADECEKFVNFHIKHLSDSRMSEMAKKMEGDWVTFALTIGLSKEEIDMCRREEGDSNEGIAFIVLCKWRVSHVAITSGIDVFNDILGRLDNVQSNMELKEYIRHVLIHCN